MSAELTYKHDIGANNAGDDLPRDELSLAQRQ